MRRGARVTPVGTWNAAALAVVAAALVLCTCPSLAAAQNCTEGFVNITGVCQLPRVACIDGATLRDDGQCTLCPGDPAKVDPGVCGCGNPDTDADSDGSADCVDGCPIDPAKSAPGLCGCGKSDADSDGDGALDNCATGSDPVVPQDECPNDANKTVPGHCGCGRPETDTDGDGTPDCVDCPEGLISINFRCTLPRLMCMNGTVVRTDGTVGCEACPDDPAKIEPGACGCGVPDTDSDGDGVPDCIDECPSDGTKERRGHCGCGTPDTDTDGDGALDKCARQGNTLPRDTCPFDPKKHSPGVCGCGVPDTDSDSDGTPNCIDQCPAHDFKTSPGICGCGTPDVDTDGDGLLDCHDGCPNDAAKADPGTCGCGTPDTDADGDGVPACEDACDDDEGKTAAGTCGCGVSDTDDDLDSVPNCNDSCPVDGAKTAPGTCGCGVPDTDTDADSVPDCVDGCPANAAKTAPGKCGCGEVDTDTDGDGTPNCNDGCPSDPKKTSPGVCLCGTPDTDGDGDGTPNCNDSCPTDPAKTTAGVCGCGVADTDTDGDGTPDCNDGCPGDPGSTNGASCACGACGCGAAAPDTDGDGIADCLDECPDDAFKSGPGQCGCGQSDADSDGDGAAPCNDACPSDSDKLAPGACGCGTSELDSDGDGTPDCNDECPADSAKSVAGTCGCGASDEDTDGDGTADCNDACPSDANKVAAGQCGCGASEDGAVDRDSDATLDCLEGLRWVTGDWSTCKAATGSLVACGVASQSRAVSCRTAGGAIKPSAHCRAVLGTAPPASARGCLLRTCTYRYSVGFWGSCSATCGNGVRNRTASCVESGGDGEVAVPLARCSQAAAPATRQACFAGVCGGATATHRVGDWSACSASCGGGTQSRAVTCVTTAGTPSNECTGTTPASVRPCNTHRCESYSWGYTPWSDCSATCGSGAVRTRQALCLSSAGRVAQGWRCLRSRAPATLSEPCTGLPACGSHQWLTGAWGSCSKTCGGGISTRPVTCINATQHVVADGECAVAKPAFTRTCNTFPCTAYAWAVSEWSSCSRECFGVQTRAVSCVGGGGAEDIVSSSLCAATHKPATSQGCSTSAACDFCHENTCSGRGTCEGGECKCLTGFTGAYCQRSVDCSGYFDGNGTCCVGVLMPDSSCCSGASALIDATGACCASGQVDPCGVCEGSGVGLDLNGKCCSSGIDARGFCCDGNELDACGVCGGQGACSQSLTVLVNADLGDEIAVMSAAQLRVAMADLDSDARVALEFGARHFVAAALGRDEGLVHVTDVVVPSRRRLGAEALAGAVDEEASAGDQEGLTARIEELLNSADHSPHGRRAAEQRVLQTTLEVDSAGDVRVPSLVTPSAVQAGLTAQATANPDAAVVATSLVASSALGVCGNHVCEVGERCDWRDPFAACCPSDCPFTVTDCPVANGNVCNGHGACIMSLVDSQKGQCQCQAHSGFAGAACDTCTEGMVLIGAGAGARCVYLAAASCSDTVTNGGELGVDCGGPCAKECPVPQPPPVSDDEELDRMLLMLWIAIAVLLLCLLIMLGVWCTMSSKDDKAAAAALARPSTKVMPRSAMVTPTTSRSNLLGDTGDAKDAKAAGLRPARRPRDSTATGTTMTMSELDSRTSDDRYSRRRRRRSSRWTSESGGVTDDYATDDALLTPVRRRDSGGGVTDDYVTDDGLLTPAGRRGSSDSNSSYDDRRSRGRRGSRSELDYDSLPTSLATSALPSPRAPRRSSAAGSHAGHATGRGAGAGKAAPESPEPVGESKQEVRPNPHFADGDVGIGYSGNADDLLAQLVADADEEGDGANLDPGAFGSAGPLGDDEDLLAGLDGMSDFNPSPAAEMLQQPEFTHSSSRRQLNAAPPMAHLATPRTAGSGQRW